MKYIIFFLLITGKLFSQGQFSTLKTLELTMCGFTDFTYSANLTLEEAVNSESINFSQVSHYANTHYRIDFIGEKISYTIFTGESDTNRIVNIASGEWHLSFDVITESDELFNFLILKNTEGELTLFVRSYSANSEGLIIGYISDEIYTE